jgi:hypothetical protein
MMLAGGELMSRSSNVSSEASMMLAIGVRVFRWKC